MKREARHRLWIAIGCVLLSACAPASDWNAILKKVRVDYPDVRQVSTAELDVDKPRVLIDTRELEEYAVSHLPGARNVPPGTDYADTLGDVPKDANIVVYCSVGYRSSDFARRLMEDGYTNVANLEGSIFAWANEGRELVAPDGKQTSFVHPYDANWGRLLHERHHPEEF